MPTRIPSLRRPPIGFAHRGARAHAPENTLEAFQLALRLGATGLASDGWLSADGEAVLHHEGAVRRGLRRRRLQQLARDELPEEIPTLGALYEACGTALEVSLDIKHPDAAEAAVAAARTAGDGTLERLWLCHPDVEVLAAWRRRWPGVRLVESTRLSRVPEGPERRAALLAEAGVDAVNLHHSDWTGGLATLFHRFEILAFAWDAQLPRVLDELVDLGIDGIYSDHADRLADVLDH